MKSQVIDVRPSVSPAPDPLAPSIARHRAGFWIVAFAFAVAMAFSTAPTPLWNLYRQRDHFSTTMVTVAFAAYAVGVVISLFLVGHVSDWLGRRRILVPAMLLEVVAAVMFLFWPDLPGLVLARVITGIGIGMITATATAHLAELHAVARPKAPPLRAGLVATAANTGGLAIGPLAAGLVVQYVDSKLTVPYLLFLILLVGSAVGLALVPETVPAERAESQPYRPQRVAVPPTDRSRYFAVAAAAFGLFAILGLFTSLAPSFLAAIGQTAPVMAGLAAFGVFGAATVAQLLLGRVAPARQLAIGISGTALGVVVLAAGVLLTSPAGFLAGGLIAGGGAGVLFKGSLGTAAMLAPSHARGEAIAGVFLTAYVGLAIPVLGIGFASRLGVPLHTSLLGFSALVLAVMAAVAATLRRHPARA
ncbi:MFS transporter [Micromonospora sp. HM5-17]|uniref:MFS transporter n=1 Tax=Micromonospora sp. HM5-17 TaxID=2487710 RepID=UPI001F3C947C|nr:MFS transporter [Micromonospora sp. HM5-17]